MTSRTRVPPYDWSVRQIRWLRWAIGDGWTPQMVSEHVGCTINQAAERMTAERKAIAAARGHPRPTLTDPATLARNRRARERARAKQHTRAAAGEREPSACAPSVAMEQRTP